MQFCRQILWPELDVQFVSATDQWAQYSIAGPNARKVLQAIVDLRFDIGNEAFPYMAAGHIGCARGRKGSLSIQMRACASLTLWKYIAHSTHAIACGISWALRTPAVWGEDGSQTAAFFITDPRFNRYAMAAFAACFIANRSGYTCNWEAIRLFPWYLSVFWPLFGPLLVLFCFLSFSACHRTLRHWHVEALAGLLIPMFNYNLFLASANRRFGWRRFLQSRLEPATAAFLWQRFMRELCGRRGICRSFLLRVEQRFAAVFLLDL